LSVQASVELCADRVIVALKLKNGRGTRLPFFVSGVAEDKSLYDFYYRKVKAELLARGCFVTRGCVYSEKPARPSRTVTRAQTKSGAALGQARGAQSRGKATIAHLNLLIGDHILKTAQIQEDVAALRQDMNVSKVQAESFQEQLCSTNDVIASTVAQLATIQVNALETAKIIGAYNSPQKQLREFDMSRSTQKALREFDMSRSPQKRLREFDMSDQFPDDETEWLQALPTE
jgi:hypothetical protein